MRASTTLSGYFSSLRKRGLLDNRLPYPVTRRGLEPRDQTSAGPSKNDCWLSHSIENGLRRSASSRLAGCRPERITTVMVGERRARLRTRPKVGQSRLSGISGFGAQADIDVP